MPSDAFGDSRDHVLKNESAWLISQKYTEMLKLSLQFKIMAFKSKRRTALSSLMRITLASLFGSICGFGLIDSKLSIAANIPSAIEDRQFISSDGIKLHYLSGGQGEQTLVFIPGWLMPAEIFQSQLDYFSQRYKVIALDPRSQGKSDIYTTPNAVKLAEARAKDIHELLIHSKTQNRIILIGWSLGVMESLDYIHRYGTQGIDALVLIDNSIGEGQPPQNTLPNKKSKNLNADEFKNYIKAFVRGIFKSNPPINVIQPVENSALRLSNQPNAAFQILNKPYQREYYRDALYTSQIPVWYAITPKFSKQAELLNAKYPLGSSTVYPNAGHALFVDQADAFNQQLEEFIHNKTKLPQR
jgi:microsomal epoxide hydrolase